jgi:hypothetical protein
MEITSSAKQAREFFRNSARADESVKPLLTFYGVSALTRSVLLLLRSSGGEETLTAGHGIETVRWSNSLSGELGTSLRAIDGLTIRTTQGLFSDFIEESENRMCMHIASSAVDWRLILPKPPVYTELTLGEILARLPDVTRELDRVDRPVKCASVNSITFTPAAGLSAKISADRFASFQSAYEAKGYTVVTADGWCDVSCPTSVLEEFVPQFIHTYVFKTFGSIPSLHIAEPFSRGVRFSQLGLTYLIAYCLGMLVRYYPTHWTALFTGAKGDALWPAISLAQTYVEQSYPELVVEFIEDSVQRAAEAPSMADDHGDAQPE